MADPRNDKISVNNTSENCINKDKSTTEDNQNDADKLSRDWKARLVHLNSNNTHLTEPPDILVAILFLILCDNGFIPVYNIHLQDERASYYKLPSDWKTASPGSYSFMFTLPECYDFSCRFVAVVLGDLLLINVICSYPDAVNSVCLNIYEYVECQNNTLRITKSKKLLFKFKDSIVTPSRSAAFSYRGIPSASLTGLPKEILEYILVLCGPCAVCNLMSTSRLLRMLARDQLVWHTFYLQDFDNFISNSVDDNSQDWYERYRDAFLAKIVLKQKSVLWKRRRGRHRFYDEL